MSFGPLPNLSASSEASSNAAVKTGAITGPVIDLGGAGTGPGTNYILIGGLAALLVFAGAIFYMVRRKA